MRTHRTRRQFLEVQISVRYVAHSKVLLKPRGDGLRGIDDTAVNLLSPTVCRQTDAFNPGFPGGLAYNGRVECLGDRALGINESPRRATLAQSRANTHDSRNQILKRYLVIICTLQITQFSSVRQWGAYGPIQQHWEHPRRENSRSVWKNAAATLWR